MDSSANMTRNGFCEVAESNTGVHPGSTPVPWGLFLSRYLFLGVALVLLCWRASKTNSGPYSSEDNCRFVYDLCVDSICKEHPSLQEDTSEQTTVSVSANAYDTRFSKNNGCGTTGCLPELTRDSSIIPESRWSCSKNLGSGNCYMEFALGSPQDVISMNIAFHKGDERTRKIKVLGYGSKLGTLTSSGTTLNLENYTLNAADVSTIQLVARGLGYNDWLGITEVQLLDRKLWCLGLSSVLWQCPRAPY